MLHFSIYPMLDQHKMLSKTCEPSHSKSVLHSRKSPSLVWEVCCSNDMNMKSQLCYVGLHVVSGSRICSSPILLGSSWSCHGHIQALAIRATSSTKWASCSLIFFNISCFFIFLPDTNFSSCMSLQRWWPISNCSMTLRSFFLVKQSANCATPPTNATRFESGVVVFFPWANCWTIGSRKKNNDTALKSCGVCGRRWRRTVSRWSQQV